MLLQADRLRFAYDRVKARGPRPRAPARDQGRGGGVVIEGVSFSVSAGALVGILGPNGSGKTTLLRLLAGTLRPDSGTVMLDGHDVSAMSRLLLARRFATVPQETQLAFEYTVLEVVLMGRYPHLGPFEVERPGDIAAAMAALEATGARHLADRPFDHLSGGEKQRVVIASALAQLDQSSRPRSSSPMPDRVLFLDEPTASLDLKYQMELAALIRRLHDDQHIAIVLTTHDLSFAAAVCVEVVLLRNGRVLAAGPTAEVLSADRIAELYEIAPERLREFGPASIPRVSRS